MGRRQGTIGGMMLAGAMVAGVLVTGSACSAAGQPKGRPKAPRIQATALGGRSVDTNALAGRIVIVDFWATWCPPCREEIPHFAALYAKYQPRIEILGVSLDDGGESVVAPFLREQGVSYPVIMGTEALAAAFGGIRGLPTTFIIDQRGRIYKKYVGYQEAETFERDIAALLKET